MMHVGMLYSKFGVCRCCLQHCSKSKVLNRMFDVSLCSCTCGFVQLTGLLGQHNNNLYFVGLHLIFHHNKFYTMLVLQFLSVLEDTSADMRKRGRNLLTLSQLPVLGTFNSTIRALLTSLEHNPQVYEKLISL